MKRIAALIAALVLLTAAWALPASANGNPDKIKICHATSSENNPYVVINVDSHAVDIEGTDHTHHEDDIIPATPGCQKPVPTPTVTETVTSTATATATETVTATATATVTVTAISTVTFTPRGTHDPCRDFKQNPLCEPTVTETATVVVSEGPSGEPTATTTIPPGDDELAYTGSATMALGLGALALIISGLVMRGLTRPRRH